MTTRTSKKTKKTKGSKILGMKVARNGVVEIDGEVITLLLKTTRVGGETGQTEGATTLRLRLLPSQSPLRRTLSKRSGAGVGLIDLPAHLPAYLPTHLFAHASASPNPFGGKLGVSTVSLNTFGLYAHLSAYTPTLPASAPPDTVLALSGTAVRKGEKGDVLLDDSAWSIATVRIPFASLVFEGLGTERAKRLPPTLDILALSYEMPFPPMTPSALPTTFWAVLRSMHVSGYRADIILVMPSAKEVGTGRDEAMTERKGRRKGKRAEKDIYASILSIMRLAGKGVAMKDEAAPVSRDSIVVVIPPLDPNAADWDEEASSYYAQVAESMGAKVSVRRRGALPIPSSILGGRVRKSGGEQRIYTTWDK